MNTPTTTDDRRLQHPPQQLLHRAPITAHANSTRARRVGPLDRLALHVGIALITWGRRPLDVESRERRANRVEVQLARALRESEALRRYDLTVARR